MKLKIKKISLKEVSDAGMLGEFEASIASGPLHRRVGYGYSKEGALLALKKNIIDALTEAEPILMGMLKTIERRK